MKRYLMSLVVLTLTAATTATAQDVREAALKAEAARQAALKRSEEIESRILSDRQALLAEVQKLEAEERTLDADLARLERQIQSDEALFEKLTDRWSKREMEFREISGNVRVSARDLETLLEQSPITALEPERLRKLQPLLRKGYFPGIDDIAVMVDLFFDEIERSGQVGFQEGMYVARDGEDRKGQILTLGKFTAIYRDGDEVGFLNYMPKGRKLFALSALPSGWVGRLLDKYTRGDSESVPIDISGGAALRQITHKTSILDQLRAGGPIVWPIAAIAAAALIIVIAKIVFLNQVRRNTGKYMTRVNRFAAEGKWAECEALVLRHKGEHSPVNHVIEAGLAARHEERETLESVLQEAILRELPRVERHLSTLAVLGAVAPLLGLLGTVTGMIDTFRVITLFGTGDPKLMSGGISEALVTTELGLAVAIPIMLMHTYLSRRSDNIVGEMEEKAVSLTNIIQTQKAQHGGLLEDRSVSTEPAREQEGTAVS
jgi:biopolymer transport protein ExbB